MDSTIEWLQQWYLGNCNKDWEHTYGIKINTLDNPGWHVVIDLDETSIEKFIFQEVEIDRTENDWIRCMLRGKTFDMACGPLNLLEVLNIFHDWVVSQSEKPDALGSGDD
jgi:Immunity protein 53